MAAVWPDQSQHYREIRMSLCSCSNLFCLSVKPCKGCKAREREKEGLIYLVLFIKVSTRYYNNLYITKRSSSFTILTGRCEHISLCICSYYCNPLVSFGPDVFESLVKISTVVAVFMFSSAVFWVVNWWSFIIISVRCATFGLFMRMFHGFVFCHL
jgi:hypothetical protein